MMIKVQKQAILDVSNLCVVRQTGMEYQATCHCQGDENLWVDAHWGGAEGPGQRDRRRRQRGHQLQWVRLVDDQVRINQTDMTGRVSFDEMLSKMKLQQGYFAGQLESNTEIIYEQFLSLFLAPAKFIEKWKENTGSSGMATLRKKSEKLFRLFFNHPYPSLFNHPYARFPIIPVHFIQLIIYPYQLLTVVVTHSLGLIEIAQI